MFTPQQLEQITFKTAVFGGYDMQTVDDFLEPLTEDYITLYKENAVLKSKMKVLVDKIEEYRASEDAMRMTLMSSQKLSSQIESEARARAWLMWVRARVARGLAPWRIWGSRRVASMSSSR